MPPRRIFVAAPPNPPRDAGGNRQGGGGSGLAVVGPEGDGPDDPVARMFRQARQNAADGAAPAEGGGRTVVTVYANGFTVGDGPFRPSEGDPANEAFLRDVGRGLVPRELEESAQGGAVNLELVDKRGDTYEPPAYVAFAGGGQTLSSGAPAAGAVLSGSCPPPVVDAAQPTTTIAIRLASGKRVKATLNLSHTVRAPRGTPTARTGLGCRGGAAAAARIVRGRIAAHLEGPLRATHRDGTATSSVPERRSNSSTRSSAASTRAPRRTCSSRASRPSRSRTPSRPSRPRD